MKKTKNAFLIVRITDDEKEILGERAKELGISFSELVRRIVSNYING